MPGTNLSVRRVCFRYLMAEGAAGSKVEWSRGCPGVSFTSCTVRAEPDFAPWAACGGNAG